ncbi:MAG TPA: glycosyltransferase family 4 protein [Steroidobacteraceae bacterium]|jgi:glycosyltransferase involved in cell wall biosynthesis
MSARSLEFVIPGDLQAATGGYGYDRRAIAGLRALGWRVAVHTLDGSFPEPSAAALAQAGSLFAGLPAHALVLVDGLALGAMPQVIEPHAARLRLVGLIHHPLAAESGLAPELALHLAHSERLALQRVRHVLVTSQATKRALLGLGVDPQRVSVVEPGTDAAPLARGSGAGTVNMLCVGTLVPRKGHDLLFDALAALHSLRWHVHCVGSLTRNPATVARLRAQLKRLDLDGRVNLVGEVDPTALAQWYAAADLFVLPTRLEGYGMAVAEALARGLPVISTHVGAIAELVGTGAGLLVAPENADQLRAALTRVLNEPGLLRQLASGAAAVRSTLPDWQQAGVRLSQVLEAIATSAAAGMR